MRRGAPGRQVNVHLAPFWIDRLLTLQRRLQKPDGTPATKVTVIRRALGLLWIVQSFHESGYRVVVRNDEGTETDVEW